VTMKDVIRFGSSSCSYHSYELHYPRSKGFPRKCDENQIHRTNLTVEYVFRIVRQLSLLSFFALLLGNNRVSRKIVDKFVKIG
jgi:hypothetical protein